jgi:hypothetical protein
MSEAAELRAFARPQWEALKRAHGITGPVSVRDLPRFTASLAALHADGWGQHDIALMFGVTRERVRQWFRACALTSQRRGSRPRLWSWDDGRFVPVSVKSYNRAREEYPRAESVAARRVRALARQAQLVAELQALARRLDHTPRIGELRRQYDRFFQVLGDWREPGEGRWQVWVHRWYRAAGLVVPKRGRPGHVAPDD